MAGINLSISSLARATLKSGCLRKGRMSDTGPLHILFALCLIMDAVLPGNKLDCSINFHFVRSCPNFTKATINIALSDGVQSFPFMVGMSPSFVVGSRRSRKQPQCCSGRV